jgi:hypothetical protein
MTGQSKKRLNRESFSHHAVRRRRGSRWFLPPNIDGEGDAKFPFPLALFDLVIGRAITPAMQQRRIAATRQFLPGRLLIGAREILRL